MLLYVFRLPSSSFFRGGQILPEIRSVEIGIIDRARAGLLKTNISRNAITKRKARKFACHRGCSLFHCADVRQTDDPDTLFV